MRRLELILTAAMIVLLTMIAAILVILYVMAPGSDQGGQSAELFYWIVGGIIAAVALLAIGTISYRRKKA